MTQIAKNQHFVPKCLLKNFLSNDQSINIYDSSRRKLRPPTIVDRVLAENYFYDKDNLVENFLAEHIEAPASKVLKVFRNEEPAAPINAESHIAIVRFLLVQLSRTPSAHQTSLTNIDNLFDELIRQIGRLNGFDEDIIDSVKFSLNDPKDVLRMQTLDAALKVPLILDLEWHFLINGTTTDFVISDNPVINYNWYLRNSDKIDRTALTKRGTQIFLPISKNITLCLYDSKVYKMGTKHSHYTTISAESDVRLLNELQFRSRQSYIVFSSTEAANYVQSECEKIPSNSLYEHKVNSQMTDAGNEQVKSRIVQWREPHIFSSWLSFCKIKNKLLKRGLCNDNRQPEILKEHYKCISKVRENAL
ncbi:DUF4238 domain-containing protein [Vibrio vulnificus]|uniref:DUF4238 domain-containing protein n=1 Tax=Vibrio vulnificus TaxID=672 RepID=UPI0009B5DA86|nr:DUF4238 domain-containing protein [Vibrio vulnificus]EGQ8028846.1 DUF4238 domain-containing protein [Vibrio vulnificus]EHH0712162.1 DUF4238 domain-containing protein [Vibrio vulnificus]EHH2488940.1 DUF4238 domain-containing protein [Vibrio vulnificus]EHU4797700.1 DUF4238 domain-containing protein [Vibrio vulnificus]EHZ2652357.1 DUF4238 domain-containing protein [Vibrio vulnificus]